MNLHRTIDPNDSAGVHLTTEERLILAKIHCVNDFDQSLTVGRSDLKNTPAMIRVGGEVVHLDRYRTLALLEALNALLNAP